MLSILPRLLAQTTQEVLETPAWKLGWLIGYGLCIFIFFVAAAPLLNVILTICCGFEKKVSYSLFLKFLIMVGAVIWLIWKAF